MPTLRKILILTLCFIPCYATLSVAVIIPENTQGLKIADGSSDVMNSEYVKRIYGKDMWDFAFSEGGQ